MASEEGQVTIGVKGKVFMSFKRRNPVKPNTPQTHRTKKWSFEKTVAGAFQHVDSSYHHEVQSGHD